MSEVLLYGSLVGPSASAHRRVPVQGYLAHKKQPPPEDHHRSLGIGLLQGPTGGVFLMSEVPLQRLSRHLRESEIISLYVSQNK